jgi:hypothetical protein
MSANGKGNIDERLEKLVERHEALTQSVELLSADVANLSADVAKLVKIHEEHERWLVLLTKIVARHDQQLDDGEA